MRKSSRLLLIGFGLVLTKVLVFASIPVEVAAVLRSRVDQNFFFSSRR